MGSSGASAEGGESSCRPGSVIAEATLTNKYLLYMAFVNMNYGIGRGW
jgi:hypothetical protein